MARRIRVRPRSTPREIHLAVVAVAVRALGLPSAAELAAALATAGGLPVNGRGARMLAEHAGAVRVCDELGRSRYWLPVGLPTAAAEAAVRRTVCGLAGAAASGELGPATYGPAVHAALRDLAHIHGSLADAGLRAAVIDRAADVARVNGWPEP